MSPVLQFVLAGAGTFLIRLSAIALLSGSAEIPPQVERVLRMIAPSVLAALAAHTLVLENGGLRTPDHWYAAGAIAFAVMLWRRSVGWALAAGMISVWGLSALF